MAVTSFPAAQAQPRRRAQVRKAKGAMLVEPGRIVLEDKPVADIGPTDALLRVTTMICGTDVLILRGEYPWPRAWRSAMSRSASSRSSARACTK